MARSWISLLTLVGLTNLTGIAAAQIRSYSPPGGQTLPNQLDYFRPQSGFLDQYNQFVAPKDARDNQLKNMAGQQNTDYQALQNRFKESDVIRESEAAATGTAAGFMNYSHYFGSKGGGAAAGAGRQIAFGRRYTPSLPGVGTGAGLPGGIGSGIGAGGAGIGSGYRPRR